MGADAGAGKFAAASCSAVVVVSGAGRVEAALSGIVSRTVSGPLSLKSVGSLVACAIKEVGAVGAAIEAVDARGSGEVESRPLRSEPLMCDSVAGLAGCPGTCVKSG